MHSHIRKLMKPFPMPGPKITNRSRRLNPLAIRFSPVMKDSGKNREIVPATVTGLSKEASSRLCSSSRSPKLEVGFFDEVKIGRYQHSEPCLRTFSLANMDESMHRNSDKYCWRTFRHVCSFSMTNFQVGHKFITVCKSPKLSFGCI